MNSLAAENYLKALYHINLEKGSITVNELSKSLNIKMPTVNSMMKKLFEKGYIHYESYKPIHLTELGKLTAALIVRKHRLTEMYLVNKMGFGWEEVHDIAEQIEHISSTTFFDKMDEILNYPKFDPHGSPIPDKEGNIIYLNYKKLSEVAINKKVTVIAVRESNEELLKFLSNKGIKLGSSIIIISKEVYDGTVICNIDHQKNIVLSQMVTDKLLVE
jgi:DtxR family Mn-dependent transcriptional regulator